MTAPTYYADLAKIRARGERPLGGVVVTDRWRITQHADRMQLLALYFRRSDKWTDYRLDALHGLDVLVMVDEHRRMEAIAAVSAARLRSLRVRTGEAVEVIFGGNYAAAETMQWIIERARRAAKLKVPA